MKTTDLKTFIYLENGDIETNELDTIKTTKKLDVGCYNVSWLGYPQNRVLLQVNTDLQKVRIHDFPDKSKIENLFTSFFDTRVKTKVYELGFLHKTGILFHGQEGTGKSTIIKYFYNMAIERSEALVFYVNERAEALKACWDFIKKIRDVQDNPIIVIFEEMDAIFNNQYMESIIKVILDGNESIDNCIFIGSTNYIERIPTTIRERPSRFKYVLNIESIQNEQQIRDILKELIGDLFNNETINKFSNNLKGSTLDNVKSFCMDKIMNIESYDKQKKKIGF